MLPSLVMVFCGVLKSVQCWERRDKLVSYSSALRRVVPVESVVAFQSGGHTDNSGTGTAGPAPAFDMHLQVKDRLRSFSTSVARRTGRQSLTCDEGGGSRGSSWIWSTYPPQRYTKFVSGKEQ